MQSHLKKTIASLFLLLTSTLFAQNPRITWQTDSWTNGISEMTAYEAGGINYVLLSKPESGDAWIFGLNNDGSMGKSTYHTKDWEKGIECTASYNVGGKTYVFLSNSTNGHAWMLEVNKDGNRGGFTWRTNNWPKGISEAAIANVGEKNYLIMSQPDPGKVWHFELDENGKVGKCVESKDWSDIRAITTWNEGDKSFVLYISKNGSAWVQKINADGKFGNRVWETSQWEKNITAVTSYKYADVNHIMLSCPPEGKAWIFTIEADGKVGKHLWSTNNWQKGIQGLSHYYVDGLPFAVASNPDTKYGWVFNNIGGLPENLTQIKSNTPELDNAYNSLSKTQKNLAELSNKMRGNSLNTLEAVLKLDNKIGTIESKVKNYNGTLDPLQIVPYIGGYVKTTSKLLETVNDKIGLVKETFNKINKVVVDPAMNNARGTFSVVNLAENAILKLEQKMVALKKESVTDTKKLSKLKASINQIIDESKIINTEVEKLTRIDKSISVLEKPVEKFNSGVDKFDEKLKKVDKVINEINKVLDKKFEKKILKKKISISVRNILNGGNLDKTVQKAAKKFAMKLIEPLAKKLNIKFSIEEFPGIKEVVDKLEEIKGKGANMVDASNNLKKSTGNLEKIASEM
jgi:hypothetical protein